MLQETAGALPENHAHKRHSATEKASPATLALDEHGFIHHCNGPTERMFGHSCSELKGRHISTLFPQLADTELVCGEHVNPRLKFLCHCGTPFRGIRKDGETVLTELYLNKLGSVAGPSLVVIVRSVEPRLQAPRESDSRIGGASAAGL